MENKTKTKTKRSHAQRDLSGHTPGRKSIFDDNLVQRGVGFTVEQWEWMTNFAAAQTRATGVPVSNAHVARAAVDEFIARKKQQLEEEAAKLKR